MRNNTSFDFEKLVTVSALMLLITLTGWSQTTNTKKSSALPSASNGQMQVGHDGKVTDITATSAVFSMCDPKTTAQYSYGISVDTINTLPTGNKGVVQSIRFTNGATSVTLTKLRPNTTYFIYPYVMNLLPKKEKRTKSLGLANPYVTSYGSMVSFRTGSVYTTLERTLVPTLVTAIPKVRIDQPNLFDQYGYGKFSYGPGLPCQKRLDLMPANYNEPTATNKAIKLARFFTITDVHITDEESPAQCIFFRQAKFDNAISVYAPLMLYTTQMLDAAVQTINGIHQKEAFDFGLALGDLANSTQRNELRWFIDVLDGGTIKPYSGGKKDPVLGPNNDYQDEFIAKGLDKSIPWYATVGNHDHFFIGSKPVWSDPVNEKLRNAFVGSQILQLGNILNPSEPNAINESTYSMGTIDGKTPYGTIIGEGVVAKMNVIPTVTPDPDRCSLSKQEWMKEFNNTGTSPVGHGFNQKKVNNYDTIPGCYSFMTNTQIPIKVIVLDDTQDDSDSPVAEGIYGHGVLNNGRYSWLMSQLKAGQAANQLMIISAHVPIGVAAGSSPFSWVPAPGYTSEQNLISQLKSFPNLILWVAGHRHLNTVTPLAADNGKSAEYGFWEVETKSLREFPEQFRTFDIKLNSDGTISIITTNVDPIIDPTSQAAVGRSYAIASNQIYGINEAPQPTGSVSYNAELVKAISPEMQKKLWEKLKSTNN
jgi:metallophosphoesterase (TIGR03768 family)